MTSPEQHAGALIMLFNQQLDVPQLSGGWIIFANLGALTHTDLSKFCSESERTNCFILYIKTKAFMFLLNTYMVNQLASNTNYHTCPQKA